MKDEAPGTEDNTQFKAFVGGLSYQITDSDLRQAFERYDASSAKVMIDRFTGRPRGFGFVYFKDDHGLKEAIANMHDKDLDGRKISVVRAVPENQTQPGTPAAALGGGSGARRDARREPPRGGYDRSYGGYDRGYDRGGYDRGGYGGGYDPRYAYDRASYDRGYGGYSAGYDRAAADPYRDAYRGGYSAGYGGGYGSYDERSAYGSSYTGYDRGYDDRGAGGPDRRGYSASTRSAPYNERPPERRPSDPPRR